MWGNNVFQLVEVLQTLLVMSATEVDTVNAIPPFSPPFHLFSPSSLWKTKVADLPTVCHPRTFSSRFPPFAQSHIGGLGVFLLPPPWSFWFVVLSHLALIYSGKIIRISLLRRVEWKCKQCFPAGGCFITLTGAFEFAWVADRLGYLCVSRTWKPRLWLGLRLGLRQGKRLEICGVGDIPLDLGENWGWFWTWYLE